MTELTITSLSDFLRVHKLAVVHFWAAWNDIDHQIKSNLERLSADFADVVAFARFSVDPPAHHEICMQLGILNVPFMAAFRDGAVVLTLTGMRSFAELRSAVRELVLAGQSGRGLACNV